MGKNMVENRETITDLININGNHLVVVDSRHAFAITGGRVHGHHAILEHSSVDLRPVTTVAIIPNNHTRKELSRMLHETRRPMSRKIHSRG